MYWCTEFRMQFFPAQPYGDPHAPFQRKCAFDVGDYGLGFCANSLALGCDCLGHIKCAPTHMHAPTLDLCERVVACSVHAPILAAVRVLLVARGMLQRMAC